MGRSKDLATGETRFVNTAGDNMTGNLGIGTNSPNGALHVKGISDHGKIVVEHGGTSGSTNHNFISFHNHAGNTVAEIQSEENATNSSALLFKTGGTTTNMTVGHNGYVTKPNQPSWNLRPNASSTTTVTNSIIGWSANTNLTGNFSAHIQGVTLSGSSSGAMGATSSGRINFPVGGKYKIWITVRCENTPGAGNIYLNHNGATRARQHVEVWNRYNYAHGFHSHVINVAANDYIEFTIAVSGGNVSGYNDTVNWCSGYLMG